MRLAALAFRHSVLAYSTRLCRSLKPPYSLLPALNRSGSLISLGDLQEHCRHVSPTHALPSRLCFQLTNAIAAPSCPCPLYMQLPTNCNPNAVMHQLACSHQSSSASL